MKQQLAPWAEFVGVSLAAFGYSIFSSFYILLHASPRPPLSEVNLLALLAVEPMFLAPILLFLWLRGWTLQRIGLRPDLLGTLIGAGLCLAAYLATQFCWFIAAALSPEMRALAQANGLVGDDLTLGTVVAVSLVNPLYEELLVSGYVMTAVRERLGPSAAINISVAIRLLYHLYQGPQAAISIIPIGLIFAFYYARTGRLWPLIVAHAGVDFFALLAYVAG